MKPRRKAKRHRRAALSTGPRKLGSPGECSRCHEIKPIATTAWLEFSARIGDPIGAGTPDQRLDLCEDCDRAWWKRSSRIRRVVNKVHEKLRRRNYSKKEARAKTDRLEAKLWGGADAEWSELEPNEELDRWEAKLKL